MCIYPRVLAYSCFSCSFPGCLCLSAWRWPLPVATCSLASFPIVLSLLLSYLAPAQVDRDLLGWWLCERQVDSGGLNGRPEKQSDVCYSWWVTCVLGCVDEYMYVCVRTEGEKVGSKEMK